MAGILEPLELVGVHAHSEQKQGRDAAELCGLDAKTGVTATSDVSPLLRMRGAFVATTIAEYFCAQGKNVLLLNGEEAGALRDRLMAGRWMVTKVEERSTMSRWNRQ